MRYRFLFLFLCTAALAQAQQPKFAGGGLQIGRIYGKILDSATKLPVSYASVAVYRMLPGKGDTLVGGALSRENGEFNIPQLPLGPLKVKIRFMGYKAWTQNVRLAPPNDVETDLGDIALAPDAQVLDAVEVRAEKASTQLSLEKRVFNVEKNITTTGGTAEDVLKNVPSVTVDMDGNAKLRDKTTTIYVDGKPTLMSLTQIPADQIESVEVISNPSAKYEAATTGGILNIVMKKNTKPGYNGVVSAGVGTQQRYNGMVNLNVHQGKWSFSGFYNMNSANVPTKGYTHRINYDSTGAVSNYFDQNTNVNFQNVFQTGRASIDYSINNRNTLTLAGTVVNGKFNILANQVYTFHNASEILSSSGSRQTKPKNNFQNNNVEAAWKKTFAKKDKSLTALANYGWGTVSNAADWTTSGYNANGVLLPNYPELVRIDGGNNNQQAVFQVDFVNPVNDSTRLELGVRSFWSQRDQNYLYKPFHYESGLYEQDDNFSQNNRITEGINAAYVNYMGKWKHNWSYQAGFRFEESFMHGTSYLGAGSTFGYDYPGKTLKDFLRSLFPALYISKKLPDGSELGFNVSRKIQRPNFRMLMPGIMASDNQNYQVGNPNLQPEFVNKAELNYNKVFGSANLLASLYFSDETNTLKPFQSASASDPNVTVTTFVNGKNEITFGTDNTLRFGIGKNFDVMLNANVFNFKVTVDTFVNTGWAANGKVNLTYRMPYDVSVQVTSAYEGNRPIPQGNRKGIVYGDIAVKKSFFNNAANVTFTVSDVFNSRKEINVFNLPAYDQQVMRRRDSRYFKLSLQIPFGKADASMFKRMKDARRQGAQEMPDFSGS